MEKYKENINCENAIVEVEQTNNRIREEFIKEFPHVFDHEDQYDLNRNEVINWWLSKIDELLKSQREEMVEKIELLYGDIITTKKNIAIPHSCIEYNTALDDIINLIKENKNI